MVVNAIASNKEVELLRQIVVNIVDGIVLRAVVEPNIHINLSQCQTVAHIDVVPSPKLVGIGFWHIICDIIAFG